YDVAEIAKRLDRYPNFAVDTSARLHDLAWQESEAVRQFFIAYQDRILFGTDIVQRQAQSVVSESERQENLSSARKRYQTETAYYETGEKVLVRGREVQGLALPPAVLEKLYRINAQRWYPGV
ncbi:MAG: amidohydrolase family protein, partial [Anaerolineae bacterium]|nr:amidohydrolase family protein [Anaerolineae bacterium]